METGSFFERASEARERAREYVNRTGGVISKARSLVTGDARFFSTQPKGDELRRGLMSDSLFDKRDAMKRIVAQMCKGADMHLLFPDVVKNIHASSIELRKLIYVFVVHYAAECPDDALLSISAFQKDLANSSMHVRSLALRMLSSIRIPSIHPVVMVAVRNAIDDAAPVVRKTAAIAIAQMHATCGRDADMVSMRTLIQTLLADKDPDVVGAAILSFTHVFPDEKELLHPVYRNLCHVLGECEEWGQVLLLEVLLRYARAFFCDPTKPPVKPFSEQTSTDTDGAVHDSTTSSDATSTCTSSSMLVSHVPWAGKGENVELDPDYQLLMRSAKPLLLSMNSAVVVGVTSLFFHCGLPSAIEWCVKPLMRVLGCRADGRSIILNVIYSVLLIRPALFLPYYKHFFLMPDDAGVTRVLKLRILSHLVTVENFGIVYREYRDYLHSYYSEHVVDVVKGLELLASRHPGFSTQLVPLLTPLLSHRSPSVVASSVSALRSLISQSPDKVHGSRLVFRLMRQVMDGTLSTPSAQACVLWLAGEHIRVHQAIATAAPDCFRIFAKRFLSLEPEVKLQVLSLGCKLWMHMDGTGEMSTRFKQLHLYVLELARYDEYYGIQEQARMIECIVQRGDPCFEALRSIVLRDKLSPQCRDAQEQRAHLELGTFSHYFGQTGVSYKVLPPWSDSLPDRSLRAQARAPGEEWLSSTTDSSEDSMTSSEGNSFSCSSEDSIESQEGIHVSDRSRSTQSSTEKASHSEHKPRSRPTVPVICNAVRKICIQRVVPVKRVVQHVSERASAETGEVASVQPPLSNDALLASAPANRNEEDIFSDGDGIAVECRSRDADDAS